MRNSTRKPMRQPMRQPAWKLNAPHSSSGPMRVAVGAVAGLAATLLALAPRAALACSVCQGGTSDNRTEFILTTALLTFLPLLLIGGGIWGLRRRYLRLAQQQPAERPDIAPSRRNGAAAGVVEG